MKNKCGHELCGCEVRNESKYCSSYCERQGKAEPGEETGCTCGHLGCGAGHAERVEHA